LNTLFDSPLFFMKALAIIMLAALLPASAWADTFRVHYSVRGSGRSGHAEEHAGVGPLLEPGEARNEHRHGTKHLPDAKDNGKVAG
jgi:hypothetical protein